MQYVYLVWETLEWLIPDNLWSWAGGLCCGVALAAWYGIFQLTIERTVTHSN